MRDNEVVGRKRERALMFQKGRLFAKAFTFRPIRRVCWRIVRLLRSTPYVLIVWLTGDARKAASTCTVVP